MTRKPMMAGNWKMNKTVGEAVVLAQDISNQFKGTWEACDVVVCPPFVDLKPAYTVFEFDRVPINVGAQNVYWEESGAYTGEISVPMLKEIGCESLEVRDAGDTLEFVCAQVRAAFAGIDAAQAVKCVVAYEPIWAIGTGRTATPEQAQEVCAAIRETLAELFGAESADAMRVLYGGSMNPGNVDMLIAQPDIDGGLIGGAALKAPSFVQLIEACI